MLHDWSDRQQARESLLHGQALLMRGDYEGSLKEYQKVLSLVRDQSPADVAFFNMGLVHAHPQNPRKDRQKAIDSFHRVVDGYPESPWLEQAKIWVGVLIEAEKSAEEIERSKHIIEKSKQEIETSRRIIEKSKLEIEKSRHEIEKSKQVDIEIEQKRRERGR